MPFSGPLNSADYVVRPYEPGDEAAMFTVGASLNAAEAGDMLAWTMQLDETLEGGGAAWVAARGKRVGGFAVLAPVPGLPKVYELTGGVAPPWQMHGLGSRLLDTVKGESEGIGVQRLSCLVTDLTNETSRFLLNRDFYMEHEECLLEVDLAYWPPAIADVPELRLETFADDEAIDQFLRIYELAFEGTAWNQPYSAAELGGLIEKTEDLLFAMRGDEAVGVAWIETLLGGNGRIEPFGIVSGYQGRGYGSWLLRETLQRLRERKLQKAQVGLWRANAVAMNLYKRAGFREVSNWYYLACDLT